MPKLLLIDDDKEVLKINAKYFIQDGYTVKAATNARTAYKLLKDYTPDCIVLDVMMPGIDGFKACTELKKLCQAPVIFLTGRDSEDDKVQGLLLGADDYMIKPYSLRELSARIQVLIRRYQKTSVVSAAVLEYPPLRLAIWGQYIESDRKTIMVTVNRLRKKLSDYPALCHSLETVWSKGYQFIVK